METSLSEIELRITKTIDAWSDKVADKCVDRIKNAQHDCEAFRIFRNQENVKRFFNMDDKFDKHIEMHKLREESEEKRNRFLKWLVGVLISPSIITLGIKIFEILKQ